MRTVVSPFLPAWSTDRLRRTLGGAAPPAGAPLVLTACACRSRRPWATIHKFRPECSITPNSKTASRDSAGAVRKLRTTASHHLPVARKAAEEKSNLTKRSGRRRRSARIRVSSFPSAIRPRSTSAASSASSRSTTVIPSTQFTRTCRHLRRMNFFADKAAVPDIRSREKETAERIVK
jgi:hypothetical protein